METHVVICLSGLTTNPSEQPTFVAKVYGPFSEEDAWKYAGDILHLEGGSVLVRPLVDWFDTIRRISAD